MPTVVDLRLRLPAEPRDPHDVPLIFGRGTAEPEMAFPLVGDGLSLAPRLPWSLAALPVSASSALPWRDALLLSAGLTLAWQQAAPVSRSLTIASGAARGVASSGRLPWRNGARIGGRGERDPFRPPPVEPENANRCGGPLDAHDIPLVLWRRFGGTNLVFVCRPRARFVIPIRRVYAVRNEIHLIRAVDGVEIPVEEFALALDSDSYTWGFSASLPEAARALVQADNPVEIIASVNGTSIWVKAESLSRERRHGSTRVRLQGRGLACELDAPYAPRQEFENTAFARTSQQLADLAVPPDWVVDWQLDPWLVPAGSWSHQGTPISAAQAVAQAGGGYLQPHPTDRVLRVLPLFPLMPEDWGTAMPDVQVPADFVEVESLEWVSKPVYNRVFVAGQIGGRLVQATRDGTAGDMVAPMVVDGLITHVDAGRQRARPILADVGRQLVVGLRMQVHPGAGVATPGQFLRYVDGTARVGIVRAVDVRASHSSVRQSVRVQTYV